MPPESEDGAAAAAAASAVPLVPAQGNVTVVDELVCDDASAATYMQSVVPAISQLLRQLGNYHRWTSKGMVRAGPWSPVAAKLSLATSGLYEAFWRRSLVQPMADRRLRRSGCHNG